MQIILFLVLLYDTFYLPWAATITYTSSGTFTVPQGVSSMTVTAVGASGGKGNLASTIGIGHQVTATFSVVANNVYYINIGGLPSGATGGSNGGGNGFDIAGACGGGGGASDVRTISGNLASRIAVGAGGGGTCNCVDFGGNGGNPSGADGMIVY